MYCIVCPLIYSFRLSTCNLQTFLCHAWQTTHHCSYIVPRTVYGFWIPLCNRQTFHCHARQTTHQCPHGVPLSVYGLTPDYTFAIFKPFFAMRGRRHIKVLTVSLFNNESQMWFFFYFCSDREGKEIYFI
jgi:hypothetical protein